MNTRRTEQPHKPLLSVGVPVWNGLPYLEQALDSLCRQDMTDLEIIVCDNASTDGSGELVRDFASRDPRIRYYRNERNIGGSRNFNKVFQLSSGTYFRWAASDDFVTAGALSRCVQTLEDDPSSVLAFPETRLVDENGAILSAYDEGTGWGAVTPAQRFEYSLTQWGFCNVIFGVVRSSVLARTMLLGDYPASDLVLQAELAIHGAFRQVAGEYYHRRVHSRCTNALDAESLARFYEPDRKTAFDAKLMRMFRDLSRVIWRAPASRMQKGRMFGILARQLIWARTGLANELGELARNAWRRRVLSMMRTQPVHTS